MLQALRLVFCLLCFGFITSSQALVHADTLDEAFVAPAAMHQDPVSVQLVSEDKTILPGAPFWVAINMKMDPTWHAYWKNPGDAGMAPAVEWHLPEGFSAGTLQWPTPKRLELSSIVGFGYEDEVTFLTLITPPASLAEGQIPLSLDIHWLVCSDSACLPGESQASLEIAVKQQPPVKDPQQIAFFAQARALLPQKNATLSAQRKEDLVELSFAEHSFIKKADFYPEHQEAIDYTTPPLFETQPNLQYQHTIVLKEITPGTALKGILVLETANGTHAYDVDLAIAATKDNGDVAINTNADDYALVTLSKNDQATNDFDFQGGLSLALGLAFIGGLILNLMPCVLPVISFKVLGFIKLAGQSRRLILQHGLAFAGGVLLSFWVLAAVLLALQAYGRAVGWGFQLQEPIFVAILAAMLFIFALSLFGLFEIGTSLISVAGQAQQKSSQRNALVGSFFSGVLATAVATPCTGPFLGSAVGFAVTLPAIEALLIFTSIGLGMSFPYLLLAAFPALLKYMPKPGAWMVTFKELMGFLLMASVLWLVWVFSAQTDVMALSLLLVAFFLLALAGWIYGKWGSPMRGKVTRAIGRLCTLGLFVAGSYLIVLSASTSEEESQRALKGTSSTLEADAAQEWEVFSPERVAQLREQGIPVFIDFTSKWCLICQANHMVLSTDEVIEQFVAKGVVKMKADWTKRSEVITAELRKFGRNSVPLYILYGADGEAAPQILPQVLTPDVVLTALKQVASK